MLLCAASNGVPSFDNQTELLMSISDAIYRPFETLIRPLDIPYQPLPTNGPGAVLLHFIRMFRGVVVAMAVEAINLTIIWGLSVIVDGVATEGVEHFVENRFWLLAFFAFLIRSFSTSPTF